MNPIVYRSKLDLWMLAMFSAAALLCAYGATQVMHLPGIAHVLLLPLLGLGVGLPAWTLLSTRYTLTDNTLLVRSGPFAWRIALREVAQIAATRDSGSSPALSLDRLRIEYGDGRALMISPAEKARFLHDFTARRALWRPAASSERSPRPVI
jgi:hypothetical protein